MLGLLLLALVWLGACRESADTPAVRILRVGTSGDYAPFSLAGEGFDVEIARRFAADGGYRIEWVPFRWPDLTRSVEEGRFDVAMSGVTWRPDRAVHGFMTRAVAVGGPCVLGDPDGRRVAVNRGGILERWARAELADRELRAVDDNRALPGLLAAGEVEAVVTDSFELPSFRRQLEQRGGVATTERCERPSDRKVYWVVPSRSGDLGPELDRWLARNEDRIRAVREHWLGAADPRDAATHVGDLLARRLSLMPAVGAWKRARGLPLEDAERETRVLAAADRQARDAGLAPAAARQLFEMQIELAKRVQARSSEPESLSLEALRPLILALGDRILEALVAFRDAPAGPSGPGSFAEPAREPLLALVDRGWLEPAEVEELLRRVVALRDSRPGPPVGDAQGADRPIGDRDVRAPGASNLRASLDKRACNSSSANGEWIALGLSVRCPSGGAHRPGSGPRSLHRSPLPAVPPRL